MKRFLFAALLVWGGILGLAAPQRAALADTVTITLPESCNGAANCNSNPHYCGQNSPISPSFISRPNFPDWERPTDQTYNLGEWGLTWDSNYKNVAHYIIGTQTPGSNVQTRAQINHYFFTHTQFGQQNQNFADEPVTSYGNTDASDAGQENSRIGQTHEGDFCDTMPMQTDGIKLRAYCTNPQGDTNFSDCSDGRIVQGFLREQTEFLPGMAVRIRYRMPSGQHAWSAVWIFEGFQQSPYLTGHGTVGGPYNADAGCSVSPQGGTYGVGCIHNFGPAFENDFQDGWWRGMYCFDGDSAGGCVNGATQSVKMGQQFNSEPICEGCDANTGDPNYVQVYGANTGEFRYYPPANIHIQGSFVAWKAHNLADQYTDQIINWKTDGTVEYAVGIPGKTLWKYKEVKYPFPRPSYTGVNNFRTKADGTNTTLGTMVFASSAVYAKFLANSYTTPLIDNDGIQDGWTLSVQAWDDYTGTITNLDNCKPENGGCPYIVGAGGVVSGGGGGTGTGGTGGGSIFTESVNCTVITTTGTSLTDAAGNTYAISTGSQILFNGQVQSGTGNVVKIAYYGHLAYQLNSSGMWYSMFAQNGTMAGSAGTGTSPLPDNCTGTGGTGSGGGSLGGAVTQNTFTFTHPAIIAGATNSIWVRDADQTSILAKSNNFAVIAQGSETITVNQIANQAVLAPFTVSGAISNATGTPTLQYQDASGIWQPFPSGSTVTATSFSFPHPAMSSTASTTVSVRDAANQLILGTSNVFQVTAAPVESLSMNAIGTQVVGQTFQVSGSITNGPTSPVLQYQDNGSAWQALPAGAQVTQTSFSFTHPGPAGAGSSTIGVRDSANTTAIAVSPAYLVRLPASANNTVVSTAAQSIVNVDGDVWAINSNGQATVNGSADTSTSNVVALAYVSSTVWRLSSAGLWFSKAHASDTWAPSTGTTTSPLPPENLTINAISSQNVGVPFNVTGVITAALLAPTLQYSVNGGIWLPLPSSAQVTNQAFNFTVPGISTAGAQSTIAVRDAGTVSILATSAPFAVNSPASELISVNAIASPQVGIAFTVTGSIRNATGTPNLQYQDGPGPWLPLPSGSIVSSTAFSFSHPGLLPGQAYVVSVRDAANQTVVGASVPFNVTQHESQNLATVTTVGPSLIDAGGNVYTLTAGRKVAINGVVDVTSNNAIEIAYVNRQVWYEDGGQLWRAKAGAAVPWAPSAGTLLGPLPSSKPTIMRTVQQPLAVVSGFSIVIPGIVVTDTIGDGLFRLAIITANGGSITMTGSNLFGSGTAAVTQVADLVSLNAALQTLTFNAGPSPLAASVTISITDPGGAHAVLAVPITVTRAAGTIQHGKTPTPKPRRNGGYGLRPGQHKPLRRRGAPIIPGENSAESVSQNGPYAGRRRGRGIESGRLSLRAKGADPYKTGMRPALPERKRA